MSQNTKFIKDMHCTVGRVH